MAFTITELSNDRFLVTGEDALGAEGRTVLNPRDWLDYQQRNEEKNLKAKFDEKVEEFYSPLVTALETLREANKLDFDPLRFVTVQEEVAGQTAKQEQILELSNDSAVYRALTEGQEARVIWVSEDRLELTKAAPQTAAAQQAVPGLAPDQQSWER